MLVTCILPSLVRHIADLQKSIWRHGRSQPQRVTQLLKVGRRNVRRPLHHLHVGISLVQNPHQTTPHPVHRLQHVVVLGVYAVVDVPEHEGVQEGLVPLFWRHALRFVQARDAMVDALSVLVGPEPLDLLLLLLLLMGVTTTTTATNTTTTLVEDAGFDVGGRPSKAGLGDATVWVLLGSSTGVSRGRRVLEEVAKAYAELVVLGRVGYLGFSDGVAGVPLIEHLVPVVLGNWFVSWRAATEGTENGRDKNERFDLWQSEFQS